MKLLRNHIIYFFYLVLFFAYVPLLGKNTYLNHEITTRTIANFIEPLPDDAADVINWINKNAKKLRYLATTPRPLSSWEHEKAKKRRYLSASGLENEGSNNFVFKCPGTQWWIKISGPLRRLVNIYVYNTDSNPFIPEEYMRHNEFKNENLLNSFKIVPTFQTISRFANYLLCKQACIQNNISKIYFPEMYLVHIPGNPTFISDENYIIVEKEISNIENICTSKRAQKALTQEAITQLYTIITQCGIFDFNGDNLLVDENNNLIFIDLEQGIVENPAVFFNKDKEMFDFRVFEGISSFAQTHLNGDKKRYDFLRSLVIADTTLRSSTEWQEYKDFFSIQEKKKHPYSARKILKIMQKKNRKAK